MKSFQKRAHSINPNTLPQQVNPRSLTPQLPYNLASTNLDKRLRSKEKQLRDQIPQTEQAKFYFQLQVRWAEVLSSELTYHKEQKSLEQSAAVLIQKAIRGHLTRSKYWPVLLSKIHRTQTDDIKDLTFQTNQCTVGLGAATKPAVHTIEAHYIRYKKREKIYQMRRYYNLYMLSLKEKRYNNLKSKICSYACKLRIAHMKFERYKTKRLVEIKRRLAVLSVKNGWKKFKLSFRIIKDRLVKIKRRRAALAMQKEEKKSPSKSQKHSPVASLSSLSNSDSDDSILRLEMTEDEYKAYIKNKRIQKQKRKEKIDISKVAHGYHDYKEVDYVPIMQEKALEETEEDENHVYTTTVSVRAKHSDFWQFPSRTIRNTMISSPRPVHSRRGGSALPPLMTMESAEAALELRRTVQTPKKVEYAHFMMKTSAFNHRLKKLPLKKRPRIEKIFEIKNEEVLQSTKATAGKQQKKKTVSRGTPWRPSTRLRESYTPALDNNWYIPIRWTTTASGKRGSTSPAVKNNIESPSPMLFDARVFTNTPDKFGFRLGNSQSPSTYVPTADYF